MIEAWAVKSLTGSRRWLSPKSAFAGFRFPPEVIVIAVRWYLRYNLFRWVRRFTPLLADAARFTRHSPGDRWCVDETYVKVNRAWRYVYRAADQYGQVIDVLVSTCWRRGRAVLPMRALRG
jgi:transposase-like protein